MRESLGGLNVVGEWQLFWSLPCEAFTAEMAICRGTLENWLLQIKGPKCWLDHAE